MYCIYVGFEFGGVAEGILEYQSICVIHCQWCLSAYIQINSMVKFIFLHELSYVIFRCIDLLLLLLLILVDTKHSLFISKSYKGLAAIVFILSVRCQVFSQCSNSCDQLLSEKIEKLYCALNSFIFIQIKSNKCNLFCRTQCDLIGHVNRSNFLVMRYSWGIT